MSDEGSDPFHLEGKNIRQVIPQIRKNIRIQKARMIGAVVSLVVCLAIGYLGTRSSWRFFQVLGVGFLFVLPFALLGTVKDGLLLRKQKARLAECERRLAEDKQP